MKYSPNYIQELQKLYPKIRIPFYKHHEYYLDLLLKDEKEFSSLPETLVNLLDLENTICKDENISISKYKMQNFDKILEWFNNTGWIKKLNDIDPNILFKNSDFKRKEFNDFKEGKIYISVDLVEANWSVLKKYVIGEDILETMNWYEYTTSRFQLHPAVAHSKSFRQYILGNTNPKRLNRLTELAMQKIINTIKEQIPESNIVSINSDEIIMEEDFLLIELPENTNLVDIIKILDTLNLDLETRIKIYTMSEYKNHGELVRVKNFYNYQMYPSHKELFAVVGTRFYIHYKNLILGEKELDERDLLYMNGGFESKWII